MLKWLAEKVVNIFIGKLASTAVRMFNDWLGSRRAKEAGRAEERARQLEANEQSRVVADKVHAETEAMSDEDLDKELMGDDK